MSEAVREIPEQLKFDTADRLRKALRFADVSVAEMAEHLGMSRNSVGRYINGHIAPDLRTLRLWSFKTGVPLDWLRYGGTDGSHITAIMQGQPSGGEIVGLTKPITDPDTVAALRHSLGYTTRTGRRAAPRSAR